MLRTSYRIRMTQAAKLLVHTDMEIMDIALECGYGGRQSFTDAFSKAYGISPARFRRKLRFYPIAILNDEGKDMVSLEQKASLTSLISAFGRAYHTLTEPDPIYNDSIARALFSENEWSMIASYLEKSASFFEEGTSLRDIVNIHIAPTPVCRAAYCETALRTALLTGTRQYVILGAGLDTYAYRSDGYPKPAAMFELDLPQTQSDKAERIARAGLTAPKELRSVPIDLSDGSLSHALTSAGFDLTQKSFFSWLGVSYYMDRESIEQMLASVASVCADGSTLLFDFADAGLFEATENRVRKLLALAIGSGEPMKSCFSVRNLQDILMRHGFLIYEHLSPADIQRQIIGKHSDMKAFEHIHYLLAVRKA